MITAQKGYDLSLLEELDNKKFVREVIVLYINDTAIDLKEMKRLFDSGFIDRVCKIAHKLKSSTGMLQANLLFGILAEIEKISISKNEYNRLGEFIRRAQYEFDQLQTALEFYLAEIPAVV